MEPCPYKKGNKDEGDHPEHILSSQPLEEIITANTWVSDLWTPELCDNKFLLL
jgi:hypothetical protein